MILLEAYPQQMEPGTVVFAVVFLCAVVFLYMLRNTPGFRTLWRLVVIFFLVLFGTIFWNNIKTNIKDFLK
jgi:hypothetical protein